MMNETNTTTNAQSLGCRLHTGKVIHAAVEVKRRNPYSGNEYQSWDALCGKRPPKSSLTYGYNATREVVNCGKCLAKLNQQ